ncbi:hypothetical protein T265_07220 [Opisthorchis viverrini]|uniref:Uncharacterized protein n=1 Tax=Opisthorchis viverrini TaxID=6198 RepID=A0A074ZHV4_OPIVI|nr:hypothetical protein T265_07220 [Opisthorchis viverrini]KER25347.1 hypothetical protein T265_07220 [Opisthorchis viverrini]
MNVMSDLLLWLRLQLYVMCATLSTQNVNRSVVNDLPTSENKWNLGLQQDGVADLYRGFYTWS